METKKYLDEDGLKYLWSKISLEDYPNNTVLAAVINATESAIEELQEKIGIISMTLENVSDFTIKEF